MSKFGWDTEDEINFLKRIDKFKKCKTTKLELLKLYKNSIKNRVNWGKINKYEVSLFLDDEIKKLESEELRSGKS